MKPEYFPLLGEPKCQLYFDLQAMIADNGGRLKLADKLEAEMVKPFIDKYKNYHGSWSKNDLDALYNNYHLMNGEDLSKLIGKPLTAVNAKIHVLLNRGLLDGKYKRYNTIK